MYMLNILIKNDKYINLLVNDKEILKKYSEIWNKIKGLIKKEFNSELLYNDKNIEAKIKIYNNRVYKNFEYSKIPKNNKSFACLPVILLDAILLIQVKNNIHKCFQKNLNMQEKIKNSKCN